MIRVRYLGFFSEVAGTREAVYDVERAAVRELVDPRVLEASRGDLLVLVNGVPASLDTEARDGDTVAVLPHIGGG